MSTPWDRIYRDYLRGGPHYATLGDEVLPQFIEFVEKTSFPNRSAFDIGVGDGRYLRYLRARGFKLTGIDSSKTAIDIAKKSLGRDAELIVADMYDYTIPRNEYDFIFSTATIHHGLKAQIEGLIKRIHDSLVPSGRVFLTLPVHDARDKWKSFTTHEEIAPGTIAPLSGPEKGLPHAIYTEAEVKSLLSEFRDLLVSQDDRQRWIVTATT